MSHLKTLLVLLLLTASAWGAHPYPYSTSAEIHNGNCGGSGTVVGVDDGKALILSCQHLFEDGIQSPYVTFSGDENRYRARVLGMSVAADLSALEINAPAGVATAKRVRAAKKTDSPITAVGWPYYGRGEVPHWTRGKFLANQTVYVNRIKRTTVEFLAKPHVVSGFSGGGAFADDGSLVGVVTGYSDNGESIATSGASLENFAAKWLEVAK